MHRKFSLLQAQRARDVRALSRTWRRRSSLLIARGRAPISNRYARVSRPRDESPCVVSRFDRSGDACEVIATHAGASRVFAAGSSHVTRPAHLTRARRTAASWWSGSSGRLRRGASLPRSSRVCFGMVPARRAGPSVRGNRSALRGWRVRGMRSPSPAPQRSRSPSLIARRRAERRPVPA